MIDKVLVIENRCFNPYYNLAVESVLLDNLDDDTLILYLWQNANTVVIGRYQNAYLDVNIKSLYNDGGLLARRSTGGGAVYHDINNLNFSFISKCDNYDKNINNEVILNAIKKLNLEATVSGRNDFEIDGKKFSGNAYLKKNDAQLHHGTILVDVNKDKMSKYLNVKPDKFYGKGVSSVKARTCNLKEYDSLITIDKVKNAIIDACKDIFSVVNHKNTAEFSENDIKLYQNIYSSKSFIFGESVKLESNKYRKFDWGYGDIHFTLNCGIIDDIIIYSDTLDIKDVEVAQSELKGKNILNDYVFKNRIASDVFNLINEK